MLPPRSRRRSFSRSIEAVLKTVTATLKGFLFFNDGSYISTKYMADIRFNFRFKNTGERWTAIADLSRTDVPDTDELKTIKRSFPHDFSVWLLSPT
jgi:hypothetical protein